MGGGKLVEGEKRKGNRHHRRREPKRERKIGPGKDVGEQRSQRKSTC